MGILERDSWIYQFPGPAIGKHLLGNKELAESYMNVAMAMLYNLKTVMRNGLLGALSSSQVMGDGTIIQVRSAYGQDQIIIDAPFALQEPKEYREYKEIWYGRCQSIHGLKEEFRSPDKGMALIPDQNDAYRRLKQLPRLGYLVKGFSLADNIKISDVAYINNDGAVAYDHLKLRSWDERLGIEIAQKENGKRPTPNDMVYSHPNQYTYTAHLNMSYAFETDQKPYLCYTDAGGGHKREYGPRLNGDKETASYKWDEYNYYNPDGNIRDFYRYIYKDIQGSKDSVVFYLNEACGQEAIMVRSSSIGLHRNTWDYQLVSKSSGYNYSFSLNSSYKISNRYREALLCGDREIDAVEGHHFYENVITQTTPWGDTAKSTWKEDACDNYIKLFQWVGTGKNEFCVIYAKSENKYSYVYSEILTNNGYNHFINGKLVDDIINKWLYGRQYWVRTLWDYKCLIDHFFYDIPADLPVFQPKYQTATKQDEILYYYNRGKEYNVSLNMSWGYLYDVLDLIMTDNYIYYSAMYYKSEDNTYYQVFGVVGRTGSPIGEGRHYQTDPVLLDPSYLGDAIMHIYRY